MWAEGEKYGISREGSVGRGQDDTIGGNQSEGQEQEDVKTEKQ